MPVAKDITGQRFSRLVVLERAGSNKDGHAVWKCLCDCGEHTWAIGKLLRTGHTRSCGCLQKEIARKNKTTHGMAAKGRGKGTAYYSWLAMRQRCEQPNHSEYRYYGARGIKVCPEWSNYQTFVKDMGERPSAKHSIERIDNDKGYEPSNCRWATATEQSYNRRSTILIEYKGEVKNALEWSKETGFSPSLIVQRHRNGWPPEKIFTTPVQIHVQTR